MRGGPIQQLPSHAHLLRDVSRASALPARSRRRPAAIIVPAARPAAALSGLIRLAADLETQLVVLCSHQTRVEPVSERIRRTPRARGLVIQVDQSNQLPQLHLETSSPEFLAASSGRASDLSLKRNFGLLLARLLGWDKIVFIDDDITVSPAKISRVAAQLDYYPIAGMICREFPDNSVVCHARRLARLPQDNFVTGAVMGVNCSVKEPLQFFPDLYNEDWCFFARAAARRQLVKVGEAKQAWYDPFASVDRARHEEFGDLLAEGLYSLIRLVSTGIDNSIKTLYENILCAADARYWSSFIDARLEVFDEIMKQLEEYHAADNCSDDVEDALASIDAARKLYDSSNRGAKIDADLCASYVDALRWDGKRWNDYYQRTPYLGGTRDPMRWLGVDRWVAV